MVNRLRSLSSAAILLSAMAISASAQDPGASVPGSGPANLAYVEGAVDVVLEGVTERADPPMLLLEGDVVRTKNGRAEVVFNDGTILHLSNDAELEVLGPEHLRLLTGRMMLRLSHAAARPYVVDTPASSVRMDAQGEYGITADRAGRLEVSVARGNATVGDEMTRVTVRGGEMATLMAAGARPTIQFYNSARWDAFAQWAYGRTNGFSTSYSAQQLPYELRPYSTVLDQYGRWDYVAPHGYVWFPSVAASWRPYYDGAWSFTRYGWTWNGRDRWAWPTHHYGRWGFNGSFWYWIPANVWGPAWVSWGFAPGYVSWAPLGWDGRPAIRLRDRRDHPAYAPNYSPWRGWTVIPRDSFRPRGNVRAHAIDGDRLDDLTQRAMALQATTSDRAGDRAVSRDTVLTPGARGNVRRPPSGAAPNSPAAPVASEPTTIGSTRRRSTGAGAGVPGYPVSSSAAPAESTTPTTPAMGVERDRRGTVRGVPQDDRRSVPQIESSRGTDRSAQPRNTDPRSGDPRNAEPSRIERRGGSGGDPRSTPRSEPRDEPRAQAPQPSEPGAVQRGATGRSAPATGAPAGNQPRPPGGDGGARRRPPA